LAFETKVCNHSSAFLPSGVSALIMTLHNGGDTMLHDLLLDVVNKWRVSDLLLLLSIILAFSVSWFTVLALGLKILKIEIRIKRIIPAVLAGSFIAVFIKPFVPNPLTFFVSVIPLFICLKILSRTQWVITAWVVFILLMVNTIGPWLLINPLSSINHDVGLFFFNNRYGLPIIGLIETLGAALLLISLNIFDIPLTPQPNRLLIPIDFIDIYIFLALCYWSYIQTVSIWKNPMQFMFKPFIDWGISGAATVAFYLHKVKDRRKDQEYQHLKESKVDSQELTDFSDKLSKTLIANSDPIFKSLPEFTSTPEFTSREKDVLHLIAEGYDNVAISEKLHLAQKYVGNLIVPIRAKINDKIANGIPVSDRMLVICAIYWSRMNK
jgi:DNA-binding CsgD family transcriptional regulator